MSEQFAKGVRWDLSDLYKAPDDPRINDDLSNALNKALEFESTYKPLMQKLNSNGLNQLDLFSLLNDYKQIVTLSTKPIVYAHLFFAEKTDDHTRGAFLQRMKTETTNIQVHLIFWEVLWNKLDSGVVDGITRDPKLSKDIHYLNSVRIFAPHTLAEGEEKIMAIMNDTGAGAFSRLFDETMNNIPLFIEIDGKRVQKTEEEILSYFHSPDRDLRKKASESLAEGLKGNTRILTYIFNMILADSRSVQKIRSFKHPMDSRNLSNETDFETIEGLITSVKAGYPLAGRFYNLKRRLLGLTELYDYDRYAPISQEARKISFDECKQIVLSGYYSFSNKAGKIAEEFFDKNWIDAEVRPGKQSGGFCCGTTPDLHPFILVNYTDNIRDVMTLAHELGHGIHQYLARGAGILESSAALTMAETASVFGEMIIFDKILSAESDPKRKLHLICGKIDDNFATVFRQVVMTDFELMSHEAGIREGELSHERLSGLWIKANSNMYGDSVILTDSYGHGWKYIPHFIHSTFYCYAYAFAQLFVLCLYKKYQENKEAFVPKYFEMLSLGGSKKPEEIASIAGINIRDPKFWQSGLSLLEDLVIQAELLSR